MLQDQEQAQQFKSLELPDSIAYLGPKLNKGKAFEDAELRANAAGTCGLAALICAESSCAFAQRFPRGVEQAQGLERWHPPRCGDIELPYQDHLGHGRKAFRGHFHLPAVGVVRRGFAHQQHVAQQFPLTDAPLFR
jgi:hypothetical protein